MKKLLPVIAALIACVLPARAQGPSPAEAKLRELLKTTTQRATTAENEAGKLKGEKVAADAKIKELEESVKAMGKQLETLNGEMSELKKNSAATEAELKNRLGLTQDDLKKHKVSLDKWKAAHTEISAIARKKESERANAADRAAAMEKRVSDLRIRNSELFKTGNEILDRYRKFGLGQAIAAREPFTGITRVKLENLVQEYQDKLLDQTSDARPRPPAESANPPQAAPPTPKPEAAGSPAATSSAPPAKS